MKTVSLVIPAFNEEEGIGRVIERSLATTNQLAELGLDLQLIVVDDGSQDRTAEIVARCGHAQLVRHPRNRGYGAAIKSGFRQASGDYLAFIDADGTYPPESLAELCRTAIAKNADMVLGSRMNGVRNSMPRTRWVGNFAYATLLSWIGNVRVHDTTSGMRVIRRDVLERLYPLPDGLEFTPVMSTRAIHENLKIIEVPIPYAERIGRSKLSVVRDGFRFTNAIVWTGLAYNPVRILGFISLVAFAIAFAIAMYIFGLRLSGVTTLSALQVYAIFISGVLGFIGVSLFTLGAMFNYLVALFHKSPVRRGLFGKPIFEPPLDHHFGWFGLVAGGAGIVLSAVAFASSLGGWDMERLWFYLLASGLLVMTGLELVIAWLIMRILEELARREVQAQRDMVEPGAV